MPIATLSSKSQLVLPADIRRKLGIRPGDRLIVEAEDGRVVIHKAPESEVDALARFRAKRWKDYAETLNQVRDEWNT